MLTLKIKGRLAAAQVADYAEASKLYAQCRDKSGEGASTFPDGALSDGARVSYNGKVWVDGAVVHPAPRAKRTDLSGGQTVWAVFNRGQSNEARLPASIVENIDATCKPLTDMWRIKIDDDSAEMAGCTFGFSGEAIDPR